MPPSGARVPRMDVRRAADRFSTRIDWLDSHHSFSFGHHYDPANTHHGVLMVNNDDVVASGRGFDTHPHRDMEIVTWVLRGSLVHQDSMGNSGVIYPGLAQRMSAGTGVLHSEKNDAWRLDGVTAEFSREHDEAVRLIQMWVVPDEPGLTPGYEQLEVDDALLRGGMVTVASGMDAYRDHAAIRIHNRHAAMHVVRLRPDARPVTLPDAPLLHVFVARGPVDLEGAGPLAEGDAVRITGDGGVRLSPVAAPGTDGPDAEVIVWEMHAGLGGPV
ncbi:pirin family protein [Tomitella gaofuii]|uniref:pirin family protein n=1 Tax=Tomitella gaofuii TaxID=2760083 RepID=UPI0015FB91DF|nr:pirin family protein [Tomitella gaofuii]